MIDLWCVRLGADGPGLARHWSLLSTDEQARAERFHFAPDRDRWIVARSSLRRVLALYATTPARKLRFEYGVNGKPSLVNSASRVSFNLAHSEDLAVIGVTYECPIGVDVERIRRMSDAAALAQRYFDVRECGAVFADRSKLEERFFACWTRREALVKALGVGLSFGVDRFAVSVPPNDPPRVLWLADQPDAARYWALSQVEPASGFIAAVAVRGPSLDVRVRWMSGAC